MKRNWAAAREKCEAEQLLCRICARHGVEAAHIIPRSRVKPGPGEDARNICPLCPAHHRQYDARFLDLLPYLSIAEQAYAVELVGLVEATRYITNARAVA